MCFLAISLPQLPLPTNAKLSFLDARITGEVDYVPITETSPANKYWGIDQTLTYGDGTTLLNSAGIVDTGTTLLLIATGETFIFLPVISNSEFSS